MNYYDYIRFIFKAKKQLFYFILVINIIITFIKYFYSYY